MAISKKILNKTQSLMQDNHPNIHFDLGMRYGNPSILNALKRFKDKAISKILIIPLYPQAGSPTTASTIDAVNNYLNDQNWIPNLRFVSGYHDNGDYINAVSNSIESSFKKNGKPDKLLFSYHGMPKRYLEEGDPYYCFCHKTTRLITEKLNLPASNFEMAFQSRFGYETWLQPYIDERITDLAKDGVRHIQVVSPGFSADCLETLEEINIQYKKLFYNNGGKEFTYIPCLNDDKPQINMIKKIIEDNIQGW